MERFGAFPLDRYDLDAYTLPYWQGGVVYQESVMMLEREDGGVPDAPLLYSPTRILSLRSSDLKTEYRQGVDYVLVDGKIRLTPASSIPTVPHTVYYPKNKSETSMPRNEKYGSGYVFFSEGSRMHAMQLAVTYLHDGVFPGAIPPCKARLLKKAVAKLERGGNFRICVYGDSISTGANATKTVAALPYAKPWFEMLCDKLNQRYGKAKISLSNPSLGGKTSEWGRAEADSRIESGLDLCLIGFGMNDGTHRVSPADFRNHIEGVIESVLCKNPDCAFVLISTMIPNPEVSRFFGYQPDYLAELEKLEQEGVAVADMTSFHCALLSRKRYFDMSGNNVNHPNDFLSRAYAQVLYQTVAGQN